jgi:hypothetical protein
MADGPGGGMVELQHEAKSGFAEKRGAMTKEDIEGSDKWLNDPGPISEEDLEVSDDDFEMWMMRKLKPEELRDAQTRGRYEVYLRNHG